MEIAIDEEKVSSSLGMDTTQTITLALKQNKLPLINRGQLCYSKQRVIASSQDIIEPERTLGTILSNW